MDMGIRYCIQLTPCRSIVNTLPDKGAKLKNSIAQIDALLRQQEENTASNTTQPNIRKMSIQENGSSSSSSSSSRSLLAAEKKDDSTVSCSMDTDNNA